MRRALVVALALVLAVAGLAAAKKKHHGHKQRKQQQKMLTSLQNGNTVVTSGGIVGTIVAIDGDDTLVLRVKPDNVKIQVARSAVSSVVSSAVKK